MALINTTEELRAYVAVSKSFDINNIQPLLEHFEQSVVVAFLGQNTFNSLLQIPDSDSPLETLKAKAQKVVANFAMARYTSMGEVQIENAGITTVGKSEDRTAAYEYQVRNLEQQFLQTGGEVLDDLLQWIAQPNQLSSFPQYANSEAYLKNQKYLIKTASEFSDIYYIADSYTTFAAIRPAMQRAEKNALKPIIGSAQYTRIKTANNLTDAEIDLLDSAKNLIVFATLVDVIELNQNIDLSSNGLRVHFTSSFSNVRYFTPPTDSQRRDAATAARQKVEYYRNQIASLLSEITPTVPTPVQNYGPIANQKALML